MGDLRRLVPRPARTPRTPRTPPTPRTRRPRQISAGRPLRATVAVATAALLVASAVAALSVDAATWAVRSITMTYSAPAGVSAGADGPTVVTSPGAWLSAARDEVMARVGASDNRHGPVVVAVEYQPPGASTTVIKTWCSASPWFSISPGSRLRTEVLSGRCPDGTLALPSSGSMTVWLRHRVVHHRHHGGVPPAQRWAVVIGIQHYAAPTEPTYGGDGDATAVIRALRHAGWLSSHILVLRDGAATGSSMLRAMRWLVAHSSPSTFTLFHYSGHVCIDSRGPCAAGHTYLWSADNRFLSETTVRGILGRLRGHAWVDIAGCEAGAFAAGIASPSRLFTGSSQPGRTSYEEPDWHESVWAGLVWDRGFDRGAASNGRRYAATIGAMVHYGVVNTERITQGQSAGQQRPYVAGGSGRWLLSAPPV